MDVGGRDSQAVSGKRNLTHQMLWLREGPKNRESSGERNPAQKYFFAFFHHSVAWGLGCFVDKRVAMPVTLAAVGGGPPRPYSPANLARALWNPPCPS